MYIYLHICNQLRYNASWSPAWGREILQPGHNDCIYRWKKNVRVKDREDNLFVLQINRRDRDV